MGRQQTAEMASMLLLASCCIQQGAAFLAPKHIGLVRTPSTSQNTWLHSQWLQQAMHVPVAVRAPIGSMTALRASSDEDDAMWGLTDLGSENFGRFGTNDDPYRNIKPQWLSRNPAWLTDEAVDFLPELREIKSRIHGANLFIVGMPGSGKTTLGRMLAEGLQYRWIDMDEHIERSVGKTAGEVFAEEGEAVWRKKETETLKGLQTFVQTVVSTGGGIMTIKENFPLVHTGLIIWLDLDPDGIIERMKATGEITKRPLLKKAEDPAAVVRKLYEERRKGYSLADVRVQIRHDDNPVRVLRRVTHRVIEELDLRPPKAKAWEDKRQRMRQMWQMMRTKGEPTNINTPIEENKANPAVAAITRVQGDDAPLITNTGVKKEGEAESKAQPAAVGSQGLGFGLGLDEYYGSSTSNSDAGATKKDGGDSSQPPALGEI